MPAFYQSANLASLNGQKQFLRYFRARLVALLVAAVGGAVAWRIDDFAPGAAVAVVFFLAALAIEYLLSHNTPERIWYEGRAAAESAKTLTWRFVVGGESFPSDLPVAPAKKQLIGNLNELLQDLEGLQLSDYDEGAPQISDKMVALRSGSFEDRKALYKSERIEDQRKWYAKKSTWNGNRAHNWGIAVVVCEFGGAALGTLAAFGVLDFDILGILAAVAAAIVAWNQAKQHKTLATAYDITSQELASISSELDMVDAEADWAEFVGQAEEAISREHTLWRASRGIRIKK